MSENNGQKEIVKKGEIVIIQGQDPEYIHFLHSGSLEILSSPSEYEGLDPDIIIEHGTRVGVIQGKSLISGLSILFTEPYQKSIRAIEDSEITKYPIQEGGFKQICTGNISLSMNILAHLYKRLELSLTDATKYTKLYQNILKINDNVALLIKELASNFTAERLLNRAEKTHGVFVQNGGEFPSHFDSKFLIADNSSILKKKYDFPGLPLDSMLDIKQNAFLKRLLQLNPKLIGEMVRADPEVAVYMFETLSDNLLKVLSRIEAISNEIKDELALLYDNEESWSSFLVDDKGYNELMSGNRVSADLLKNFLSLSSKINAIYKDISGKDITADYGGLKKLHSFFVSIKETAPEQEIASPKTAAASPSPKSGAVLSRYKQSIHQIFEFALADKEFQKRFLKQLTDFKTMKNPFDTETEGRKVRRALSKMYWELYGQVLIRSKTQPLTPLPARLMLHFGYLDDELLDGSQIEELHDLSNKTAEQTEYPIYLEEEFLSRIHAGKLQPSLNEMGLTYEAHLREQGRSQKGKGEDGPTSSDENINKVLFEVNHRLTQTAAVCSGSTATAFPILTNMVMKGNPTNFHISKKKLESIISSLRDVDFSVFYRETVAKLDEAREVIEEEVFPNFVLLPTFGSKTMLWQEVEGNNRRSRGRIVIPVLFIGDLLRNMAHTFACFRYEVNRTIKGGQWRDPVEGGLTGIYLDYVQFFKKNPKLSIEAKEKINEKFRSIRDDRNRFADDYILWLLFEKDGIPKLNTVVRDIFYKNIRFKKEIRERLETMPAFSEIANRFKNVHTRNVTSHERKFKKYADANGILPDPLQKYMDYLNM